MTNLYKATLPTVPRIRKKSPQDHASGEGASGRHDGEEDVDEEPSGDALSGALLEDGDDNDDMRNNVVLSDESPSPEPASGNDMDSMQDTSSHTGRKLHFSETPSTKHTGVATPSAKIMPKEHFDFIHDIAAIRSDVDRLTKSKYNNPVYNLQILLILKNLDDLILTYHHTHVASAEVRSPGEVLDKTQVSNDEATTTAAHAASVVATIPRKRPPVDVVPKNNIVTPHKPADVDPSLASPSRSRPPTRHMPDTDPGVQSRAKKSKKSKN